MKNSRRWIKVTGIVQGVGFRPFVYRVALEEELKGWVNNGSEGVLMELEGPLEKIQAFQKRLIEEAPLLAQVEEVFTKDLPYYGYDNFQILKSQKNTESITLISPDLAMCPLCEEDIKDIEGQRYKYPFTNCTNCGPRFSIIKELPYDRHVTTMNVFEMCEDCKREYDDPMNRRFHAQPNACPKCGPKVWLTDPKGVMIEIEDPLEELIVQLKKGAIAALKGLGGFQLICDGKNEEAVRKLRERKKRPEKPLAVMMKDLETVKGYCEVSEKEEEILKGIQKPILLLNKKQDYLPLNIAPRQKRLGVMLPYTPLHSLLFDETLTVLVMTSGNSSSLPIIYKNEEAIEGLGQIADYFLLHNREIHMPVDDSVACVMLGKERVIRRSRGYSPMSLAIKTDKTILAYGAHLKNTFALSTQERVFLGQHIGDLENLETCQHLEHCINHFKSIYGISPEGIAYDLHPQYLSSLYAQKNPGIKVPIQHHHAHIASCMAEHGIEDKVIGIAYDGTGYGTDGKIWGGELLICDYKHFKRTAHLAYMKMPGGDAAVKAPWRMAVSQLYNLWGDTFKLPLTLENLEKDKERLIQILKYGINCPETSSMGRLFDSVSALLGLCSHIKYEAQGAIELENRASLLNAASYTYTLKRIDTCYVIHTEKMIEEIVDDLKRGTPISQIAGNFHKTVINFTVEVCCKIYEEHKISKVVLSGGVFQNHILLKEIYEKLTDKGFQVYTHEQIPCNDGGVALGQLMIASHHIKEGVNSDVCSSSSKNH